MSFIDWRDIMPFVDWTGHEIATLILILGVYLLGGVIGIIVKK